MIDLQKLHETKEKILNAIKASGPSFPTRISRESGISPLFVGALLSEMVAEKKIVTSTMKIGSSPLYFIPGQEVQLENFVQHLNPKEREAVEKLKKNKVMDDETEDPAIRVALRKLKDFAIPLTVRIDEQENLCWKYFTVDDAEAKTLLEPGKHEEKPEKKELKKEVESIKEASFIKPERKKKQDIKPSAFAMNVKDYLLAKNIEIIQDIASKSKEYNARVRIDTPLGKQEYFLIAKDKKKLTEDDLVLSLHKSQTEKMPAMILATGEIEKTAKPYADQWKNLLKIEKLPL